METPKILASIDWTALRTQKTSLLATIEFLEKNKVPQLPEDLDGILHLIDALQDYAVDELGVPEMLVYDFEQEEERELSIPTGIKAAKGGELNIGDETKQIWLCGSCGSDNVEIKNWVNPNTGEVGTDCEDDLGYCQDCELHSELILSTVKASAKVIGFQVVGDDGTAEDGEIHPSMDASFCLYSLSQAKEMLEDNDNGKEQWKLLAIWTGDVEEPTIMFESDPRD
jgi:hypothetical protein